MIRFPSLVVLLSAACRVLACPPEETSEDDTADDYLANAELAMGALNDWYNDDTGLWDTAGWWISANCMSVLADLRAFDDDLEDLTSYVFPNTLEKAPSANTGISKYKRSCPHCPARRDDNAEGYAGGFLNDYFDDEGWWALAWIQVYDITGDESYLEVSKGIFDDIVVNATGAPCGGVWWNRPHDAQVAIANSLALNLAAHLANRVPNNTTYRDWALQQWNFFSGSGLITGDNLVVDGFNPDTCKAEGNLYTYNQGSIVGALVELNKMEPDYSYISTAKSIASAAIANMTDANGILHEMGEPDTGVDGSQFKGVLARNIQYLQQATGDESYKQFLEINARSIWNNRNGNGQFGVVWSEKTTSTDASMHSSALNAIVGAAAVQ